MKMLFFILWAQHHLPRARSGARCSLGLFLRCAQSSGCLRHPSMLGAYYRYTTTIVIARRSRGNPYTGHHSEHSSYLLFRSRSLLRKLAHYRVLLRFAHQNSRLHSRSLFSTTAHKLINVFGSSQERLSVNYLM